MPVNFSFGVDEVGSHGMRLPYPADLKNGRTNHGFKDLRGHPEAAADVPEAACSPALRSWLTKFAATDSRYISIGCDTGGEQHDRDEAHSGGYMQFCYSDSKLSTHRGIHHVRGRQLEAALLGDVGEDRWDVEVEVIPVDIECLDGPPVCWSYRVNLRVWPRPCRRPRRRGSG